MGRAAPFGGGVVLADDQQQDGQSVSVGEIADVVRPAGGLARVLLALGFDGEEERPVVLCFDAQEGVHPAFDGTGLGEVGGQGGGRGGRWDVDSEHLGDAGEEAGGTPGRCGALPRGAS